MTPQQLKDECKRIDAIAGEAGAMCIIIRTTYMSGKVQTKEHNSSWFDCATWSEMFARAEIEAHIADAKRDGGAAEYASWFARDAA